MFDIFNTDIQRVLPHKQHSYWCLVCYQLTTNLDSDYASITLVGEGNKLFENVISLETPGRFSLLLRVQPSVREVIINADNDVEIEVLGYKPISNIRFISQFAKRCLIYGYKEGLRGFIGHLVSSFTSSNKDSLANFLFFTRQQHSTANYQDWLSRRPLAQQDLCTEFTTVIAEHHGDINRNSLEKILSSTSKSAWLVWQRVPAQRYQALDNWINNQLSSIGSDVRAIYFDHDYLISEERQSPHFKASWDALLFQQQDYLGGIVILNMNALNDFISHYSGEIDNTFLATFLIDEEMTHQVVHVPLISHSILSKSTHLDVLSNEDEHNLSHKLGMQSTTDELSVTVIIPTRDNHAYLSRLVKSIERNTDDINYRLLIIDNQSRDKTTIDLLNELNQDKTIEVISYDHQFNYSAINNFAVNYSVKTYGDSLILLLNDDTEVISSKWLKSLVNCMSKTSVGAVGAKLYYPNDTIQHAGVTLGTCGVAGHTYKHFPRMDAGPWNQLMVTREVSAVTGACLLTSSTIYQSVAGLDDLGLTVAFNDIDFCLKVRKAGYQILWTPDAELYHYESISRGDDLSGSKRRRFKKEVHLMKLRWGDALQNDPFYNSNLAMNTEYYRYNLESGK